MPTRNLIVIVLLELVKCELIFGTPTIDPIVNSKVGVIKGLRTSDGDYNMFLGIPYAKVDENNPFGDSIPYPKFEQVFEAFNDTAVCPQREEFNKTIVGTLNCLHLNVFVPNSATSSNHLPVLVWIHGGSFQFGSYNRYVFGPKFLTRHDIVLVTLNYRLGPYGFMCPEVSEASGNQGLKDQLAALNWIKNNIGDFGGDAEKITISGESAGAASVDLHLYLSDESLFHQAILQSGVSLSPWVMHNPGTEGPLKLAEHLGFATDNVKDALTFLATVNTDLVINATEELGLFFCVCVEKKFPKVKHFLEDYPINIKSVPKVKNIPVLIGFNSDEEVAGFANVDDLAELDFIKLTINQTFNMDTETLDEMSEILKHFYFGDKDVNHETKRQAMDLSADFSYGQPTQMIMKKYYDSGAKTVYSYMFSYVGERNIGLENRTIITGGASHTDEIGYLFDVAYKKTAASEDDQLIVDRITTLWANFVKYGDPTPETTDLLPVKWIPATKDRWNYLNIDSELTLESRPFSERMAFLDLFFKTNKKYLIGYRDDNNSVISSTTINYDN